MSRILTIISAIILLSFLSVYSDSPNLNRDDLNWELVKVTNDIRIYKKDITGSEIKSFKGEGILQSRIEVLAELLLDVDGYKDWVAFCTESTIVYQIDDNNFYVYLNYKLPWPISNRDIVAKVHFDIDAKTGKCLADISVTDEIHIPMKKSTVRLKNVKGTVWISYVDRETVEGCIIMSLDPGGYIPLALTNYLNGFVPFYALNNIKKKVKEEKYIKLGEVSKYKLLIEESIKKGYLKN